MSFNHLERRRQIMDILFLYGAIMVIMVCKLQLQLSMENLQIWTLLMVRCTRIRLLSLE